jgi:hypothetical protein
MHPEVIAAPATINASMAPLMLKNLRDRVISFSFG